MASDTGRTLQRRDSLTDRLHTLQRKLTNISAEDVQAVQALIDPSSLMATSLAETQELEDEKATAKTGGGVGAVDKRHVRRDEIAFFFGVINVAFVLSEDS